MLTGIGAPRSPPITIAHVLVQWLDAWPNQVRRERLEPGAVLPDETQAFPADTFSTRLYPVRG